MLGGGGEGGACGGEEGIGGDGGGCGGAGGEGADGGGDGGSGGSGGEGGGGKEYEITLLTRVYVLAPPCCATSHIAYSAHGVPQSEPHVTYVVEWLFRALRAMRWTRSTVITQASPSSPALQVAVPLVHVPSPSLRVTVRVPRSIERL